MDMRSFTPVREGIDLQPDLTRRDLAEIVNANMYFDAVCRGATAEKPRRDHSQLLTIHRLAHLLGVDALEALSQN